MSWNATTRPLTPTAHRGEAAFFAALGVPVTTDSRSVPAGIGERIQRIAFTTAPPSTLLVRALVGSVFLLEGNLKLLDAQGPGVDRFVKVGFHFPSFFAPLDGLFEIGCGIALMLGFLTRLGAVPMIVNMIVAITTTRIPVLLQEGFWKAAHEARLDCAMLFSCVFLLLVGAGPLSLDSLLLASPRRERSGFEWMQDED